MDITSKAGQIVSSAALHAASGSFSCNIYNDNGCVKINFYTLLTKIPLEIHIRIGSQTVRIINEDQLTLELEKELERFTQEYLDNGGEDPAHAATSQEYWQGEAIQEFFQWVKTLE